jgi:hypothetical protein
MIETSLVSTAVTEHHNAAPRVTMPKTQYDSGRIRKRAGFRLGAKDVFLNITGGILMIPR